MFDKMKQLYDMQKKAREMQRALEDVRVECTEAHDTLKLVMNGLNKVVSLSIDPSWLVPDRGADLEKQLSRLISDAAEEVKKTTAAQAMTLMKGMDLSGLMK